MSYLSLPRIFTRIVSALARFSLLNGESSVFIDPSFVAISAIRVLRRRSIAWASSKQISSSSKATRQAPYQARPPVTVTYVTVEERLVALATSSSAAPSAPASYAKTFLLDLSYWNTYPPLTSIPTVSMFDTYVVKSSAYPPVGYELSNVIFRATVKRLPVTFVLPNCSTVNAILNSPLVQSYLTTILLMKYDYAGSSTRKSAIRGR